MDKRLKSFPCVHARQDGKQANGQARFSKPHFSKKHVSDATTARMEIKHDPATGSLSTPSAGPS
jgi:hypothetical protein